jgi:hypothetical protein
VLVYCFLELFRQCGILCLSIVFWNYYDSVVSCVFLLYFGTIPTVWYFVFFYCILELFRQCGILCFSIVFWNYYDSVVFCVFHFIIEGHLIFFFYIYLFHIYLFSSDIHITLQWRSTRYQKEFLSVQVEYVL